MDRFIFFCSGLLLLKLCSETVAFEWEENTDQSLFESDIELLPEQKLAIKYGLDVDKPINLKRGIAKDRSKLWVGGIVPYTIVDKLRNDTRPIAAINAGFADWETQTCIQFVPWRGENDYIEFVYSVDRCSSQVGRAGGKQTIRLTERCWQVGTVAHEIAHALGFWHEQSRPDRDNYIEIIWNNIPKNKKHNFKKYSRSDIDSLGYSYDYLSVMHYSSTAFGKGHTTIKAKDPSALELGQRLGLSPTDVRQANALYKCNGKVTKPPPSTSLPPSPPSGPYDCTFENGTCGYENVAPGEKLDDFDWTRKIGPTPSRNTGPSQDHSVGKFGIYVYIEASSPRKKGDKALFRSPYYPASISNQCFGFYYHMWGDGIGELGVYLKKGNVRDKLLWLKRGNQGDAWHHAKIQLLPSPEKFKIMFVGVRGNDFKGDVAIDDIHFTNGPCVCTFESGTCGYENVAPAKKMDDFDWSLNSGSTPSIDTGPSADHTFGKFSGTYVYIETSSPRKKGDKALFASPFYPASISDQCFGFYYHMLGKHIGQLNVYLENNNLVKKKLLWTKHGNQGDAWHHAKIQLSPSPEKFKIVFEGVRGGSWQGDIAIDDIQLRSGKCN